MVPRSWVLLASLPICVSPLFVTGTAATATSAVSVGVAASAPTSASIAPSAAPAPTSASIAPSATQAPTSASIAPSATQAPTSASIAPSATQAPTSASIAPSLSPNRLHVKAALTFAIQYSGGELGLPSPLRRATLKLPAGLTLDIPELRSCSAARLQADGVKGCPAHSEIGSGHALVEASLASGVLTEHITLWAFLGPPRNLQPTFEILGEGHTPLSVQMVLGAVSLPDSTPYGEELVMSIPPIPTVPGEPDAAVVTFSLTIGATRQRHAHDAATVVVPAHCPAGGLPFAAEFTYANGSSGSSQASTPCPL
jgi:hypothetical protein